MPDDPTMEDDPESYRWSEGGKELLDQIENIFNRASKGDDHEANFPGDGPGVFDAGTAHGL